MDIEYLLLLQGLRESAPAWLNAALEAISEFAISPYCVMLVCVVFWCVSKEAGTYLLLSHGASRGVNAVIKDTFCVYRPWIRDSRVQSSLMATATGYSFPSGHTTTATAVYGGIGVRLKKQTGKTYLLMLCLIPALLTGFARNWVGAHTPQDVAVGFLATLVVLFLVDRLLGWIDQNPDKDVRFVLIFCAVCAAALLYVAFKPYPMDYAADGALLVDPDKMTRDAFGDIGGAMGVALAWLAERRLVRFTVRGCSVPCRVARGAGGAVVLCVWQYAALPAVQTVLTQPHLYKFVSNFSIALVAVFLYPLLFAFAERQLAKKSAQSAQ